MAFPTLYHLFLEFRYFIWTDMGFDKSIFFDLSISFYCFIKQISETSNTPIF